MNEATVDVTELKAFLTARWNEGARIIAVLPNRITTRGSVLHRNLDATLVNVIVIWV